MSKLIIYLAFLLAMVLQGYSQSSDTIPFVLGDNNAIYITGSINGSGPLKLIFTPNSDHTVLYKAGELKGAKLMGQDSADPEAHSEKLLSHGNTLTIDNMNVQNESVIFNNKYPTEADGIIGKRLVDGKTIELNYDNKILVLHGAAFIPNKNFRSIPMRFKGTTPYVEVTLANKNEAVKGWFELDPGGEGSLSIGSDFSNENHLYELFERIGEKRIATTGMETIKADIVKIPRVGIASFAAEHVTADLHTTGGEEPGSVGNDFLKRFNLVIDYRNNLLWLRPNHLIQVPYKIEKNRQSRDDLFLPFTEIALFLGVFAVLVFVFITLMNKKRSNT